MKKEWELTSSEIFNLRKAIIERFGVNETIWFKKILPALEYYREYKSDIKGD